MGSDRAATGPLRVGVVLESISPARWIEHALQLIADGAVADLTTAIIVAPRMATPAADWANALYRLFVVADRRVFRRQPDPLAVVDISRPLNGVAIISIGGEGGLPATARIALEEAGLDVMLCFGSGEAGRNLAGLVRFGVWYFPDIVSDAGTGRPLWFDATVAGRDVVTTSLNELTATGTAGRTVYSAVSAVNRYSPHYTDRRIRWKMATFPARALEKLARTGADAHDNHGSDTGIRETSIPRNVRMLRIMARLGARQVAHAVRSAL